MPTARPSDAISANPRTICMVASVVISALIRNRAMTMPLTKPTTAPHSRAASSPTGMEPVAFETITAIMPEKATIDPTERSKSREARQNIMVQATMPIVTTDCRSPSMFRSVRKFGTKSETITKAAAKITTSPCSPRRIFFNEFIVRIPGPKWCLRHSCRGALLSECCARRNPGGRRWQPPCPGTSP